MRSQQADFENKMNARYTAVIRNSGYQDWQVCCIFAQNFSNMLKGILAIAGQPGLYRMVAEAKNRIIVESLLTGKKMPASATSKISSLEDIAVYTKTSDMPLKVVLKKISEYESGGQSDILKATPNEMKAYFGRIISDYDADRVYVSDIKKIISWYNILQTNDLLNFEEEENTSGQETGTSPDLEQG